MDKPNDQFYEESSLSRNISILASLICLGLVVYEQLYGNSFSNMVVMLYCAFLLPTVGLTKKIRERYFLYTQEYIIAFRGFTSLMCAVFLMVWLIAFLTYQSPPPFPGQ